MSVHELLHMCMHMYAYVYVYICIYVQYVCMHMVVGNSMRHGSYELRSTFLFSFRDMDLIQGL